MLPTTETRGPRIAKKDVIEVEGIVREPLPNAMFMVELANGQAETFDIVVLAIGFGLEAGRPGRVGYWNDADGLDAVAAASRVEAGGSVGDPGDALESIQRLSASGAPLAAASLRPYWCHPCQGFSR